jgi:hypothetical protein
MTPLTMRRLELAIVAAGLLILLFASKPPRSGNAEIPIGNAEMIVRTRSSQNDVAEAVVSTGTETQDLDQMLPADPPPRAKRIGVVDARKSGNPKYTHILYGEIAVRWVWDGQKSVPKKVCIVDEGNGVTSVWTFDDPDENVIVSEQ